MMTTNLFVTANVKQLRTGGSFRILLPFSRTSWSTVVLNSAIFNSYHNRVEFATIFEGLRNFGGGEGLFEHPNPQPPSVRHWGGPRIQIRSEISRNFGEGLSDVQPGEVEELL
jgi:hypothetical protein